MNSELKVGDKLVQKQTFQKSIQFVPEVCYRIKNVSKTHNTDLFTSLKSMIDNKFFKHEETHNEKFLKQLTQVKTPTAKSLNKSDRQRKLSINKTATHKTKQDSNIFIRTDLQIISHQQISINKQEQTTQKCEQSQNVQSVQETGDFTKIFNEVYLKIKYIVRLSNDCLFIGNQNRIELLQFSNSNRIPKHEFRWSIDLNKPIKGIVVSKYTQPKFLLWTEKQVYVCEFNPKNLSQKYRILQKKYAESQNILSIQYVKRNIFIIICFSHIEIHEIFQLGKNCTVTKLNSISFQCPRNFEVISIPEQVENNIKIFYANMQQYKEKQKKKHSKSKNVFGLYFVQIQYNCSNTVIHEMKKVYQIKSSLRNQIKLFNVNSSTFLMNLKAEVVVVKNGLIIDNVGVNYRFDDVYIKILSKDLLVHILSDKIQFYKITFNMSVMPQKLVVKPFDSIKFQRPLQDKYLSIVPVNQGYGIFFQSSLLNQKPQDLKKGIIKYWYCLTYPVLLKNKLQQIFPTPDKIANTQFQLLDLICDMAIKMGLSQSQAYRQLWKRTKKQSDKDFQILLTSKNYKIITQQIILQLKKKAQKYRIIAKNEAICLQILRPRVYSQTCTVQNLQQYTICHFFNLKLKVYKDIQVEKKRLQIQHYNKIIKPSQFNIFSVMLLANNQNKETETLTDTLIDISQKNLEKSLGEKTLQDKKIVEQNKKNKINEEQTEKNINNGSNKKIDQDVFLKLIDSSKKIQQVEKKQESERFRQILKLKTKNQSKKESQTQKEIRINIKDYNFYREYHLKQFFIEIAAEFMNKQYTFNDQLKIFSLRALIKNLRLYFRLVYQQILVELISTYKHKFYKLICYFKEILPYQHNQLPQGTDQQLFKGIWFEVSKTQIQDALFISDITTTQNRQPIKQFQKSIWFKRNRLSHHGLLEQKKQQMFQRFSTINLQRNRQHYFYLFFQKVMQRKIYIKKQIQQANLNYTGKKLQDLLKSLNIHNEKIDQLLEAVQTTYPLMPDHLKGFTKFYYYLYLHLQTISQGQKKYCNLYQFLKLRDFQLFKIFFEIQKKTKGFLLNHIIPLYLGLTYNGKQNFIIASQHYFNSDLSEITDLKTILNRLNGAKKQFHIQFQHIYDILVDALMDKIRISNSFDIPLDQLLIYINNIPFSVGNISLFQKLLFIQEINLQAGTLKQANIDMSITQIKNKPQQVIGALVQTQIKKHNLMSCKDQAHLNVYFWSCISQLLCLKRHFYGERLQKMIGFIFVTQLIHNPQFISYIDNILSNYDMRQMLSIQQHKQQVQFRKKVVHFAYKRCLSNNQMNFLGAQPYIRRLLVYLDEDDKQKQLIELQFEYCHLFLQCNYYMPYPLSLKQQIPILDQIQYHIQKINSQNLQKMNVQGLFEILESMRSIIEPDVQEQQAALQFKKKQFQKILFQFVFFRHLRQKNFTKALQIIQKLIRLQISENCIIYDIFLIDVLLSQFNDKTADLVIKLISYFYYRAEDLSNILKYIILTPLTTKQLDNYLEQIFQKQIKSNQYCFYKNSNVLFGSDLRNLLVQKEFYDAAHKKQVSNLFQVIYKHLEKSYEYIQKNKYFQIIYRMMLVEPFSAAKFIYCKQGSNVNLKALRAFFSYLSQQIIFQPKFVLKVGKLQLLMILKRMSQQYLINLEIKKSQNFNLHTSQDEQDYQNSFKIQQFNKNQKKIYDSFIQMKNKIQQFDKNMTYDKIIQQHKQVKKRYDENEYIIKKNTRQQEIFSYLNYSEWAIQQNKILYYLKNLKQLASYDGYKYVYTNDKDDTYIVKGQQQEFSYPRILTWPKCQPFDKIENRHKVLVQDKYTRVEQPLGEAQPQMRHRKKSQFLPGHNIELIKYKKKKKHKLPRKLTNQQGNLSPKKNEHNQESQQQGGKYSLKVHKTISRNQTLQKSSQNMLQISGTSSGDLTKLFFGLLK